MKFLVIIFAIFLSTCASPPNQSPPLNLLDGVRDEWIKIPAIDGGWEIVHAETLNSQIDAEFYAFHPYEDMQFFLWTSANPSAAQEVLIDDAESLRQSNFNPQNPTRFMIHGWGGSGTGGSTKKIRDGYLANGDYNFFGVDWSIGADTNNYVLAAERVGAAGNTTAYFIQFLIREGGLNIDDLIITGHSLGGQVVGHVGKNMPSGLRIPGIVGFDPAGPLFSIDSPNKRLDAGDGDYVEVIHTNTQELGFRQPIGHADFYPNGGEIQPGCSVDIGCSHDRCKDYFAESITSSLGFWAVQCESFDSVTKDGCTMTGQKTLLGGDPLIGSSKRGVYWLQSSSSSPFALGSVI